MGTSWCEAAVISLGFSRSHRALVDAARTAALFANAKTHSPCERIPGPRRLMQKRKLFPELRGASPSRVALPRRIRGSERFRDQVLEYGPDSLSVVLSGHNEITKLTFDQGFPETLGSTDSCSTAVHTKPFSTSVLQGLSGVFATTTKICTRGGSSQVHTQSLPRHPCDLPTRCLVRALKGLL